MTSRPSFNAPERSSELGQSGRRECPRCHGDTPPSPESIAEACWSHARQSLTGPDQQTSRAKVAERFESIAAELRELIRKSDWNNRDEERGSEQDSWRRALEALAGDPDQTIAEIDVTVAKAPGSPHPVTVAIQRAWRAVRPPRPVLLDLAGVKLEAVLQKSGCPVCLMASDTTRRWLFMLLWEGVMDPEVRGKIRAADGFCSHHWWRLQEVERAELHSVGGIAILAEDTLSSLAEQLRADRTPSGPTTQSCLACSAHRRGVDGAISGILRHLNRSEFRSAYFASEGCCARHRPMLSQRIEQRELATAVDQHRQ